MAGNRDLPNFIGFMSNPVQNIDPRALTQVFPLFGSTWTSASPPVPDANFQILGPSVNIALSERLSFGLTQGGYAFAHFDRRDSAGILDGLQRAGLLNNAERLRLLATLRQQGRLADPGRAGLLPDLERAGLLRDRKRGRILGNLNLAGLLGEGGQAPG